MATAREKLINQVNEVLQKPISGTEKSLLKNIIYSYRVQIGTELNHLGGGSAREKLITAIVGIWVNNIGEDIEDALRDIMRVFRMQLKPSRKKKPGISGESITPATLAPARVMKKTSTPVAGGPKIKSSKRGECPKCRSAGIVVAHESSGDNHFSCIYCGFQMFQSRKEGGGLELSVATQLLGRKFNESDNEI